MIRGFLKEVTWGSGRRSRPEIFVISRWFSKVNPFIFGLRPASPARENFEILVEFSSAKTSFSWFRPAPPAENFKISRAKTVFLVHISRRNRPEHFTVLEVT